ncbi:MAG: hypothetical protein K2K81_10275 [Muribaculaceae bacterium]|nr:hypothetical protein [Muribaculaceae bacterium]
MTHLTKLTNKEVVKEINIVVHRTLLGFSEVTEKGRLIRGIDFSYIINEVIPKEINKVLEGREIFEREDN